MPKTKLTITPDTEVDTALALIQEAVRARWLSGGCTESEYRDAVQTIGVTRMWKCPDGVTQAARRGEMVRPDGRPW